MEELSQALVGAVLPDDDHYDNATLNSPASHAVHAITRVSNTQGDHQSNCTYAGTVRVSEFVVDHSYRAAQRIRLRGRDQRAQRAGRRSFSSRLLAGDVRTTIRCYLLADLMEAIS